MKYDRISALFLIGFAIAICVESIRLGQGSLSTPGPGLIPLGCGLILGILALILFICTFKKVTEVREVLWRSGTKWRKLILTFASLIGYAFLLDLLGFRLVTLLWMAFVCLAVGNMRWKMTVFTSVVTTLACYILFEHYLGIRFPIGIFGF
jgi:putative tricarboxylic transport membrane protein